MKIIKLSAIDSTSSFLKEMAKKNALENFTVVQTNKQTKGRGQQTNSWVSEPHKNLTVSVFIKDLNLEISHQKYLNFAVSLAIFDMLTKLKIKKLAIKWPNDIMSANKKICGILIENSIRNQKIHSSILGIGLNVNQIQFPNHLKNASSLQIISNIQYNLDDILLKFIENLKLKIQLLLSNNFVNLENNYLQVLYKKNTPAMFKDSKGTLFIGKIIGISSYGNLLIELDDESVKEFGIKEISLA